MMRRQGKMPIERIQKLSARQVTFCKRRRGLFKKAGELAVLCDAQVAVITFSSSGKMYEFSSPSSSMKTILDHYAKTITCKTTINDSHSLHISDGVQDDSIISVENLEGQDMQKLNELEHQLCMRSGIVREILDRKILEEIQDVDLKGRSLLKESKGLHERVAKSLLQQRNTFISS